MGVKLQAEVISHRFGLDSAECDVKLVLPGTVEQLRPQLAMALEKAGYHVVSEDPLQARRGGVNFSMNVLRYSLALHIGFKPVGDQATQVTFSYSLKHSGMGWVTKGDLPILAREAEAIAAIALQGARAPICGRCGAENPTGSRFCRRCGAPLAVLEPAELEVLHLVAGNRAASRAILWGIVCLAIMTFCLAALVLDLPVKLERFRIVLGLLSGAIGWGPLLWGMFTLWRSVSSPGKPLKRRVSEAPVAPSLPSEAVLFSVTERTTQLLGEASPPSSVTEATTQLLENAPTPARTRDGLSRGENREAS